MDESYLVKKWLLGALTEAENEAFEALDDSKLNKEIISGAKDFKASNFSKIEDFQTFQSKRTSTKNNSSALYNLNTFLRIAAILVICLGVYFSIFHRNNTVIETKIAEQRSVDLPDLSNVTLNASSSIEFNTKGWNKSREVKLSGEAFFKVANGQKFDVKTQHGIVSVVGTEFNVKDRADYFEVICYEGIVNVAFDTITKRMRAGETFLVLNQRLVLGTTSDIIPNWKNNMSAFKVIPVNKVFAEMERQYGIKINLKNIDGSRLFTGGFPHDSLEKALQSVTIPMNMAYDLNAKNLVTIYERKD